MTYDLPYTPAYGKIGQLFDRIAKAKIPDVFTVKFLTQSLGLTSTNDRKLIPLLKKLGFLDASGAPTPEYSRLKNNTSAGAAIAEGIRQAYAPLYDANENAHELSAEELKGLVAQVSGAEDQLNKVIVGTLNTLVKSADFSKAKTVVEEKKPEGDESAGQKNSTANSKTNSGGEQHQGQQSAFRPEFRFNIEIHLPSNGTEDTYLAIFNALRKSLG